jgi:hypothetical protein
MIIKSVARLMDMMPSSRDKSAKHLARNLGWFSIALGALEIAAPHRLSRTLGWRGSEATIALFGLREIATGVAILSSRDPAPFVWGRVAGDALDLVSLVGGFGGSRRKAAVGLAFGTVAIVTAIDLICAQTLSADNERNKTRIPDYSNRTGLPKIAAQMRGAAAKDFKIPADMRAAPLNAGAFS